MSDRYIMALYTYCLSARKAVALENIELEGLSEAVLAMVKLESGNELFGKISGEYQILYFTCHASRNIENTK